MNSLPRVWNCSNLSISSQAPKYTCSTDKVCSAVRYRNIDPLGRRHEYTGGFPHEVLATDTWYTLAGSCLQFRGASAIWFVNRWWHLTSSTLISVWPCCTPGPWSTSIWCSVSDSGYLRREKGQLEKTAGSPSQPLAQQGSGGCQRSTTIYAVAIRDRQGSRSGSTVTRTFLRDDDDVMVMKDDRLVSKMEGKTNFSRHRQAVRNRDCWCLKNIDVWCNPKQFDVEADRKCIFMFHFRP